MSSTLVHPLPRLDHRQDFGPDGRYLPPPVNTNFYSNIPARPSSNLSNSHFAPPPPRTQSGMSNSGYPHSQAHGHSQARGGAESSYTAGLAHQSSHEAVRRTNSAASQHQRGLPPPPQEPAAPRLPQSDRLQNHTHSNERRDDSMERGRKRGRNSPVDWVSYFGGKPPPEIITIHDDDSPVPADNSRRPPPTANGSSTARHADKRRRTNAAGTEATYSNTNTPYSYSNHTSTESLQNTTAPTSLGSQASSGSRLDTTQTGQKRKRTTTRASDQNQSRQEPESRGPKGYLAEYGEYKPPPKQLKKQKEVHVPSIHEVSPKAKATRKRKPTDSASAQRHPTREKIDDEDGHYIVQENSKLGERYSLVQLLGQGTFGKVVKALDIRTRKEVAVKIIRAVPKVEHPYFINTTTH
jgi:dual-specificity kinase